MLLREMANNFNNQHQNYFHYKLIPNQDARKYDILFLYKLMETCILIICL